MTGPGATPRAPPAALPPVPQPTSEGPRQQRTRSRHADIHVLRDQGVGVYTIARRLGLDPKTVRRYADAATVEDLLSPNGTTTRDSILDVVKPYLHQRITDGVVGVSNAGWLLSGMAWVDLLSLLTTFSNAAAW